MMKTKDVQERSFEPFARLRAEDESDWLDACFVEPIGFEQMIGPRSAIIFGSPGSGKTALYASIKKTCALPTGKIKILPVDWKPRSLPTGTEGDIDWVNEQMKFMLDTCAVKVVETMTDYLEELDASPEWVKVRLSWFLQHNLQGNPLLRLGPVLDMDPKNKGIKKLFEANVDGLFYTPPSLEQVVNELIISLGHFGINAIWILADDVQDWLLADSPSLERSLFSFFSMLSVFENTKLSFKFILPKRLEIAIAQATGLVRRRVDKYYLTWNDALIKPMVEKRLAYVLGGDSFSISKLCKDVHFEEWLTHFGGDSPREWLDLVAPYVKYYLENDLNKPIDKDISKSIQLKSPLRFYLDEKEFLVRIAGCAIPINDLPPKVFKLLLFLYKHAGEIVTKEKLYYQAYLGLDVIPSRGDKSYDEATSYIGLIDTSIYRLRQAIEPDPANPFILQTERGYGVKLVVRYL